MSGLFSKPKTPKPPPPSAPPPTLETADRDANGFWRRIARRGRASTILTGDLVPKDIGKRSLLG